jgi:serine/threonine protein kinase
MSRQPGDHPPPEQLPAFGLGLLAPDQTAAIESHVAECQVCSQALLSVPDDALVARLREAVATGGDGLASHAASTATSGGPDLEATNGLPPAPPELAAHPRYRVDKLLGAGGMGAVYRAHHRVMDRPVALKVINPRLMTRPEVVERFTREVKAAARLSHPNIVTAFDAEQAGGTHFLVMEYVEGIDLGRLVQEGGRLPVGRACEYVRQAALGLQHAFEQGMVHRDLKPHNLMLTPCGRVKILDFGLARFACEAADAAGATGTGVVLGTVDYIAPEQADDAHHADIRSDIYSLGCTLYHLLAGRPPFPTGTPIQKVIAHVEKKPQPLTELRHDVPEELMLVLERMMAKNPTHRYQTAAEVAVALEPFTLATAVARAPRSRSPRQATNPDRTVLLEKTPVRGRKRRRLVIATVMLLFLVAGLLGAAVYRIATDKGELVIETDNEDVEVLVSKNGEVVKIIDTKTGKHVTLKSGDYELSLKDGKEGLKLSPGKVTVKRGGTELAKITRVRFIYLNLWPKANLRLKGDGDHSLAALQEGEQDFKGVKFKIGAGLIRLGGNGWPDRVEGIEVGVTCRELHFMHACHGGATGPRRDPNIGYYLVTYDDDMEPVKIPIVYGENVADWWYKGGESPTRAPVAWEGANVAAKREGFSIRLYLATWPNPRPTRKVVSIDFVSTNRGEPFCVAITAEK